MKYATYAVAKQKSEVCTGIAEVEVLFPTSLNNAAGLKLNVTFHIGLYAYVR